MNPDATPENAARALLGQLGHPPACQVRQIPGGRNNRVWRVSAGGDEFLLKRYYWSENDPRDRMGHEIGFLRYLESIGCRRVPAVLATDAASRYALLEFLPGRAPALDEVGPEDVGAAADFFAEMNAGRFSVAGRALGGVSEACFSLAEHVATTARRVARLREIAPEEEVGREAARFVAAELEPVWESVRRAIREGAASQGGMERALDPEERCLSPSDFGFHNTLRLPDGSLRFVDFEYSGWDDPAKTLADFANQPDMLLPEALSALFWGRALALFPSPERLAERLRLLEPLYQIKWACICLNEFLPAGSRRRAFTGLSPEEGLTRRQGHLERARVMCRRARAGLGAAR